MMRELLIAAVCLALLGGQAPQPGAITGRVVDAFGVLPGATVTVTGPDGPRTVVTDARGDYRIDTLPPGTYRVKIELAPAFQASVAESVVVEAGRTTPHSVELDLAPGGASATDFGVRSRMGGLVGRVTDTSGGVVPGVTVTVTRPGVSRSAETNADGEYQISGLATGRYQLEGTGAGFRRTVVTIAIGAGRMTPADLVMRIGILGTEGGNIDYVWPEAGVLGALRTADVVVHLRILETVGTRLLGRDRAWLASEHAALVIAVVKADRPTIASGQPIRFFQDAAGEIVENGQRYVGLNRPYPPGQSFVAFFKREADGTLGQAYGPAFTLPVPDYGSVTLPAGPVRGQSLPPGLRADMPVDELVAALRKLLQ